ncbi:hypothetical protein [Streptomyces sp. NPDC019539]|uniref:hypothetical protein n=1 Tax=Streptomyces sp. NPDC019539 TaxID=3365063 RepID=UPI00378D45AA
MVSNPQALKRIALPGPLWVWGLLIGTLLAQTAVHELSHAVACRYYKIAVREIGIGLRFYLFPVAYVDRTDAYRLVGRRPRVLIALAGIMADVPWIGCCAVLADRTHGQLQQGFVLILWLQMALLLMNLNFLLPTDGYDALEAGLGAINVRGRALTILRCLVLKKPRPSWLTTRSRVPYLLFGLVCLIYTAVTVGIFLWSLIILIG